MLLELGTRIDTRKLRESKLHSAVDTVAEGSPLIGLLENGLSVAKVFETDDEGNFLGFAYTRLNYPSTVLEVEDVTVVAGVATLTYTPTAATQAHVRNLNTGLTMVKVSALSTGPAVPNEFVLAAASKNVTVNTSENDDVLRVTYRRAITLTEAEMRWGHGAQFSPKEATEVTGSVTIIRGGELFIDNIDLSVDWYAALAAYVTDGGLLTTDDTSGIAVPGFRVIALPTADVPYLGFEFGSL